MARGATKAFLAASVLVGAQALMVTEPSEGLRVVAGRTFTVDWTGMSSKSRVEIDLYHCGDDCDDVDWCGEWLTALCDYDEEGGCKHDAGERDVKMPEPPHEQGMYKVRVKDSGDARNTGWGCSAPFSLLASDDAPIRGDPGGPFLKVLYPMEHDGAVAGEGYTVEFAYDNGLGSSTDRFMIDLYEADRGDGDCGKWVTSICDKPRIGCKDSTGDYDVEIPLSTRPGMYSIRVGRFQDESLYGCSGRFSVVREESLFEGEEGGEGDFFRDPKDDYYYNGDEMSMSMSYGFDVSDDDFEDDGWWKATDLDDDVASADDSWSWDDDREQRGGGRRRHHYSDRYSYSYSFSYSYNFLF